MFRFPLQHLGFPPLQNVFNHMFDTGSVNFVVVDEWQNSISCNHVVYTKKRTKKMMFGFVIAKAKSNGKNFWMDV